MDQKTTSLFCDKEVVLEKVDDGIYRLFVPFEAITTTVYFYVCEQGVAIIDSATYPSDVDEYIVPALAGLDIAPETVRCLLLTHDHGDHAGGMTRLSEVFPCAVVMDSFASDTKTLVDGAVVLGNLKSIFLPGHTDHSFGFFDESSQTLLSGDCLQLDGVDIYRNGIGNRDLYISSVEKLKQMEIKRIVAAHEYDPLGSVAEGEAEVEKYLNMCIEYVKAAIT